jgi:hypothetical protein
LLVLALLLLLTSSPSSWLLSPSPSGQAKLNCLSPFPARRAVETSGLTVDAIQLRRAQARTRCLRVSTVRKALPCAQLRN